MRLSCWISKLRFIHLNFIFSHLVDLFWKVPTDVPKILVWFFFLRCDGKNVIIWDIWHSWQSSYIQHFMSQIGQLYGKLRHLHFCPLILFSLLWGGEAKMCLNVPFLGVGVSWKRECGGLRIWGMIKEKTLRWQWHTEVLLSDWQVCTAGGGRGSSRRSLFRGSGTQGVLLRRGSTEREPGDWKRGLGDVTQHHHPEPLGQRSPKVWSRLGPFYGLYTWVKFVG